MRNPKISNQRVAAVVVAASGGWRARLLPVCLLTLTLLLLFICENGSSQTVSGVADEFVTGEVVVKLASGADLPAVASEFKLDQTPLDQFGKRPIYRLRITDGASVTDKVAELQSDAQLRVVYAEPNYILGAPEGRRPSWSIGAAYTTDGDFERYKSQWATETIRLGAAQAVARGAGVKVAVLDTGVDAAHTALAGHLIPGYDFVDSDNDPSEEGDIEQGPYGHGTHVAGLIALVAPDARIMPVRVLDRDGAGNVWVLAEALEYAINPDGDPATDDGADVINMSLSTPRRTNLLLSVLRKVIDGTQEDGDGFEFLEHDTVVVAAAGNSGGTTPEYPAAEAFHAMLAVAASDENDVITDFSTRGEWVRVLAPGENILSTVPGGGFATWRGTSMAAPIVAGVAALMRSAHPNLNNSDVIAHMVRNSKQITGPVTRRIDAGAALTTQVQPYTPPPTIQFSGPPINGINFSSNELLSSASVRVVRGGDFYGAASVDYATVDGAGSLSCDVTGGQASARCDYMAAQGTLYFAPGEQSKAIRISVVDDLYAEGNEVLTITLSNPTGGVLGQNKQATLAILDNETVTSTINPINRTEVFVRQQYLDFLGREPDAAGLAFWTTNINQCFDPSKRHAGQTAEQCIDRQRETTSAAFFLSPEFQYTGYYVYRIYKGSLGRMPTLSEFTRDRQLVVNGIMVQSQLSGAVINQNKMLLAEHFVSRPEFLAAYGSLDDRQFVDKLFATAGINVSADERAQLSAGLGNGTQTRASVLLKVVDGIRVIAEGQEEFQTTYGKAFYDQEFNRAFVLMEYFGYMRRDPDEAGFQHWLEKLNHYGDYVGAQMVRSFIISPEYKARFGQP